MPQSSKTQLHIINDDFADKRPSCHELTPLENIVLDLLVWRNRSGSVGCADKFTNNCCHCGAAVVGSGTALGSSTSTLSGKFTLSQAQAPMAPKSIFSRGGSLPAGFQSFVLLE